MENVPEYLGQESRHGQQGIPGALESDYGPLVFFDLLFQHQYRIEVDLANHFAVRETASGVVKWPRSFAYLHRWRYRSTINRGLGTRQWWCGWERPIGCVNRHSDDAHPDRQIRSPPVGHQTPTCNVVCTVVCSKFHSCSLVQLPYT